MCWPTTAGWRRRSTPRRATIWEGARARPAPDRGLRPRLPSPGPARPHHRPRPPAGPAARPATRRACSTPPARASSARPSTRCWHRCSTARSFARPAAAGRLFRPRHPAGAAGARCATRPAATSCGWCASGCAASPATSRCSENYFAWQAFGRRYQPDGRAAALPARPAFRRRARQCPPRHATR